MTAHNMSNYQGIVTNGPIEFSLQCMDCPGKSSHFLRAPCDIKEYGWHVTSSGKRLICPKCKENILWGYTMNAQDESHVNWDPTRIATGIWTPAGVTERRGPRGSAGSAFSTSGSNRPPPSPCICAELQTFAAQFRELREAVANLTSVVQSMRDSRMQ
jgi:hypothetical protein